MTLSTPVVTVVFLCASIAFFRSVQMRSFGSTQLASALAQDAPWGRRVLGGA